MLDLSKVDLVGLIEREAGIRFAKPYGNGIKRTQKGSCPFCLQGTDRFAVLINEDPQHYYCGINGNGCKRHGDAITFLREYKNLDFFTACAELGVDPGSEYHRSARKADISSVFAPAQQWQERANMLVHIAQRYLFSDQGKQALEWLHARGFTTEIIQAAQLGYIPFAPGSKGTWLKETLDQWGLPPEYDQDGKLKSLWLPEGILIPWYGDKKCWKLEIRRLHGLKSDSPKYLEIKGSSEGLYNLDDIRVDAPLVLCEGTFDANAGKQICGDQAAFVATGSITRGKCDRWLVRMGLASCVLVAYDDDAPDRDGRRSGDEGAKFWYNTLPHAIQWLPWSHDLNDMLREGADFHSWLNIGVATYSMSRKANHAPYTPLAASQLPAKAFEPVTVSSGISLEMELPAKVRRDKIPWWLVPGNPDWEKQVERNGLAEMQARRAAWFAQQSEVFV